MIGTVAPPATTSRAHTREARVVPGEARGLRVLLVTARYPPFVGGTEVHTFEVGRRLAAAGNSVTVLTTDPGKQLPADETSDGVRILRVPAWPASRDWYVAPGIYRTIVRGDWDIVHCQGYHTLVAPLAMVAAWRARTPCVVTFHSGGHSSRLRNAVRGIQRMILRPLLARAERLIAVSNFEATLFQEQLRLPRERFAVIPNGVQLPEVIEAPPATTDGTLIVSVGRLERYKGHQRLIAALPTVAAHYPDVRLQILGSGPYASALRRSADGAGVANRVQIGTFSAGERDEMASLLSRAALVALLSEYESQGIAIMEALALGRPVLITHTSALAELADHALVRAIPLASSCEDVADAILDQLRRPAVGTTVDLPTWDTCAAALLALYHTICRRIECAS